MIPSLGIWFKTKKSKKTTLKKVWTNIEYILSTEESFQHCIGMVNAWICPTFMKFQEIKTNKPIDVLSGQKNGFCSYQSLKKRRSGYCVILLLSLKINTKMTKISKKLISKKLIDGHGWIGFIEERQSGLHWPERKKDKCQALALEKSYKFAIARNPDDASDGFKKVKTRRQCKKP